jgi:prevent-host-death family protein
MDRGEWSLQDAKKQLQRSRRGASKETPQTVSKRGKPAVVILSIAPDEQLSGRRPRAKPSFVDHLLAMPKDDGSFDRARTGAAV